MTCLQGRTGFIGFVVTNGRGLSSEPGTSDRRAWPPIVANEASE
jgi:hypothetical protein